MEAKTAKKARKSNLSAAGKVMASKEGDLRAESIQEISPHLNLKRTYISVSPRVPVAEITASIRLAKMATLVGGP
jgi:hypothetical protein